MMKIRRLWSRKIHNVMNCRYFACYTCKNYMDAGYRFAYWEIEHTGIVQLGEHVDIDALYAAAAYWQGGEEVDWLSALLPKVRAFIDTHAAHDLRYIQEDDIDIGDFDWLEEEDHAGPTITVRWLAERMCSVIHGAISWPE